MLEQFLVTELFAFLIVFCRLGSVLMLMPGVGEGYVLARSRLLLALCVSLIVTPLAQPLMPPVPGSPLALTVLIFGEAAIGIFIGLISRIMLSVTHTAGTIIAFQSGLASAMLFDPTSGTQGSPFGNLLGAAAVCIFFALELHHVLFTGVADSYSLFVPGNFPPMEDFASMITQVISSSFAIAVAFASPYIVIGLLVNLGAGLIARVMPTMQVFFIIMPVQIMATVFILLVTVSSAMLLYMNHVEDRLTGFLLPQ